MYTENIIFDGRSPVVMNAYTIDEYSLHCHEDVIEVILVLRGAVKVKVSFEYFTLCEGDYVVINREDSHKIWRYDERDNLVAVFHISLQHYRASFPYIDYVLFTCESFDLAKYKGQTNQLRQMLLDLLNSLMRNEENSAETTTAIVDSLMNVLVREYSLDRYYNRNKDIGIDKLELYYTIMKYMYEQYHDKNILENIASREFYSKSYISHLFKEVGAASFQDILGYIRVYRAERLLLETDRGVMQISEQCGFSDIKYFNRIFKKWFLMKPSDYRNRYQSQIGKDSRVTQAKTGKIMEGIERLANLTESQAEYKVSITPLTLKNIGSNADLLQCLLQDKLLHDNEGTPEQEPAGTYAVIRIADTSRAEHLKRRLEKLLREFQNEVDGAVDLWFVR